MAASKTLQDLAYEHFQDATARIERVKSGIQDNRMGEASLTDIQTDSTKLSKRIERENLPISAALERINGVPNFQDIHILQKILKIAESVGRITIKTRYGNSGYGTGFLVAPGILITNNHVFPNAETAKNSIVQFYYELHDNAESDKIQTYGFVPERFFFTSDAIPNPEVQDSGLDFTLVAVSEKSKEGKNIAQIPHTTLDETFGKIIEGENCVVIQHPKGDYKKTVMKDIRMLTLKDDFLIYESDTLPGSSGAVVVGLGTGEVVAVHHSSIPNKNPQGQWLRKDGGVYKDGDSDESIDWLGNEGIRVSSIIRAIRNAALPENMRELRNSYFGTLKKEDAAPTAAIKQNPETPPEAIPEMKKSSESVLNQAVNMIQQSPSNTDTALQYFEIELSNVQVMQDDWRENYKNLVPEIVTSEAVFPLSTIPTQKSIYYLTLQSGDNPWEIAARLEALPQIRTATPDLQMDTDLQRQRAGSGKSESEMLENMKTGSVAGRQDDFVAKWSASAHFTLGNEDVAKQRAWNRIAVGLDATEGLDVLSLFNDNRGAIDSETTDEARNDAAAALDYLKNCSIVQLDTGYTDHAKVKNRFNFNRDEDFIDGSDARDEVRTGLLRHPGHGTRNASLLIGADISDIYKDDGNFGLLCDAEKNNFTELIPYRVAETVHELNRAKNLADAVNHALLTGADVLLMSLGTYPRPMLAEIAKAAYDNGVIWVVAAGDLIGHVIAPALYPGTISVAATNPNDKPWRYSSYGPEIDISAPGEDIYVPALDEKLNEIMVYGSSTGYAAAHVAAAAALWKSKFYRELAQKYPLRWQIVEAFRSSLKISARRPSDWDSANYGAGILDIVKLLQTPLPDAADLVYTYNSDVRQEWDLGVREAVHFLWKNQLVNSVKPQESTEGSLSQRARIAIAAMTGHTVGSLLEADSLTAETDAEMILKMYFDSYKNA